jgi:hypothetical protein
MDSQKEKTELEQLLESTVNSYDCSIGTASMVDTITIGDTINVSGLTSSITAGAYGAGGSNSYPYTISTGLSQPWGATNASPKIKLNGEGADTEINGESLVAMMKKIVERLNILHPNPELEAEWDQLRVLGEQYRELEKKLQEQNDMWNKLKAMPPHEID